MQIENVLFAVLGWVAGIFSSILLEWNRDSRLVKSLRKALHFELHEFRFAWPEWFLCSQPGPERYRPTESRG